MIRTCVTTTKLEQQSCTLKNSFKKQISFFDLKSVSILVVFVRIDGFKLEGGELFKEDFRKLLKQE